MKRGLVLSLAVLIGALSPNTVAAQEEEESAGPVYIVASYWTCDMNRETRADEIVEQVTGPIYQRHVDAGHLLSWGWLAHDTGGSWRRANYYAAADRDQLLAMREAILDELLEDNAETATEFIDICPTHVDYIWRSVVSSDANPAVSTRPAVGTSTYYVCDITAEDRADELVKDVFKPILDRQVEEGAINSWSWIAHDVGGKYRRLFVMDGDSHAALLNARDAIGDALEDEAQAAAAEFAGICGSHTDYLWNIKASGTAN